MEKVKLYDVPTYSRIGVEHLGLVNQETNELITELFFHHIDGMYSLCSLNDKFVHLSASCEVYILKNG